MRWYLLFVRAYNHINGLVTRIIIGTTNIYDFYRSTEKHAVNLSAMFMPASMILFSKFGNVALVTSQYGLRHVSR